MSLSANGLIEEALGTGPTSFGQFAWYAKDYEGYRIKNISYYGPKGYTNFKGETYL